ncbi:MAG TPA: helix-turn-helix domain-containing protein [Ktedonobacteraceae bacterium]|jgi:excisionase family DNA binding protein|nr:helix-turn-helix domain-containing protein [Ktedonobacteraceae bacterium]
MHEERLVDVRYVAKRLDVNPRTVLRMVERQELSAIKVAHRLRFRPSDIEKYIRSRSATPTAENDIHPQPSSPLPGAEEENEVINALPSESKPVRKGRPTVNLKLERERLELEQKRLQLQREQLELHTKSVELTLNSVNEMVKMLTDVDPQTRSQLLQELIPRLLPPEPVNR